LIWGAAKVVETLLFVGSSLIVPTVYKDMVSGKNEPAREKQTTVKRCYIKGFWLSRSQYAATVQGRKATSNIRLKPLCHVIFQPYVT